MISFFHNTRENPLFKLYRLLHLSIIVELISYNLYIDISTHNIENILEKKRKRKKKPKKTTDKNELTSTTNDAIIYFNYLFAYDATGM